MARAIFQTPTAFCGHCRHTIEMAVANLGGVAQVTADLTLHRVSVVYDQSALDLDTIRERIEGAGFPVTLASAVEEERDG